MTQPVSIGVFDSGVGGLSVWRELVAALPDVPVTYVADQAHVPYGPRPAEDVLAYADGITRFLIGQDCSLIVIACNTASAAALQLLRRRFPEVAFVGMEPAVKPAAQRTQRGVVAVMATPGTLQGRLFAETASRYAQQVDVVPCPCPGLVEAIEAGRRSGTELEGLLRECLQPALARHADTVVLACTHYPFVSTSLRTILGPDVAIIDPAPAVARQAARVLAARGWVPARGARHHRFFTTGAAAPLQGALAELLDVEAVVETLSWGADGLAAPAAAA